MKKSQDDWAGSGWTRKQRHSKVPERRGSLIIIGGGEDKTGDMSILREVASRVAGGPLVVATVASRSKAEELWSDYAAVFRKLGVKGIRHLRVDDRGEAFDPTRRRTLQSAKGVFFTGGDQLKITGELGGTRLLEMIRDLFHRGGVIAGTSAGASVMSETMLVSGRSTISYSASSELRMAPGLGFVRDMIIDQHFAQRGRIGRLLGAIAQNPRLLGIGIDENTAVLVEGEADFKVVGAGAVYVVDAHAATHSNICDACFDSTLSLFGVQLHLLSHGDSFDLLKRRPRRAYDRAA